MSKDKTGGKRMQQMLKSGKLTIRGAVHRPLQSSRVAGHLRDRHNKNRPMQPLLDNDNRVTAYGLSRSRDDKGNIVKRSCNPFVNCLHTSVGHCYETMEVLIVETYGEEDNV